MELLRAIVTWINRHYLASIILGVLLGGGVVGARVVVSRSDGTVSPPLQRGQIVQSVYGIGTVMATRSYDLKPGVTSTLEVLYVKEGDSVKQHDKLAEIDDVVYRAPFAGTVTSLPFKTGENVFAQVPVLTLVDLRDRYMVVSLEQQGALLVRRGQKVKISFDSARQETYDGVVASVYSNSLNFLARIDLSGLPPQILPGMTADVAITIVAKPDVLLVPVAALEGGTSAWVKRGYGVPSRVEVQTGIVDKDMAEVVGGGLAAGDQVIIRKAVP